MNLNDRFLNPRRFAIRKWLLEMLGDARYAKHDPVVDRLLHALSVDKDSDDFMTFVVEVYEAGFYRCLSEYKEKLDKMGIAVRVSESNRS